jgi:hypothetical protein
LAVLAAALAARPAGCQERLEPDLVGKAVAEAKALGKPAAVVPKFLTTRSPSLKSLDDAVGRLAVVDAVPESAWVLNLGATLETWYKLRVNEFLLRQPSVRSRGSSPPRSLGSLAPGQLWVPTFGGDTEVDGVKVFQQGVFLKVGQRYVLVLFVESGGAVGGLTHDEDAVFRVGANSEIEPIRASELSRDMMSRGLRDLPSLRSYLVRRAP